MLRHKIIYCLFVFAFTSVLADTLSNSAPASTTGAPGEANCTTSGCHDSYTLNSGSGSASLSMGSNSYTPSQTYHLTAEVDYPQWERFGFQLVAIRDKDSSNVGTLVCTESNRTQLISGVGKNYNRNYITYTYDGTQAVQTGKGKWEFDWTAPATNEGNVTFYLAAIAANNDGNDLGDYCYTKALSLSASPLAVNNAENDMQFNIYHSNENMIVSYQLNGPENIIVDIYDVQGNKVRNSYTYKQSTGKQQLQFTTSQLASGIYFVKLEAGNKTVVKKIFIY